jgi:hypothetical protein
VQILELIAATVLGLDWWLTMGIPFLSRSKAQLLELWEGKVTL